MTLMITAECIACGACEDQCPNTAISLGALIFEIDPSRCMECVGFDARRACVDACPVDCCVADPHRRATEGELFARARELHPDHVPPLELSARTSHFRNG